ncbi:MAG: hypothetical protein JKY65_14100 [Planctomycetes bacterium]|nr:hypothetical protein [Planctomycetota bacterium]
MRLSTLSLLLCLSLQPVLLAQDSASKPNERLHAPVRVRVGAERLTATSLLRLWAAASGRSLSTTPTIGNLPISLTAGDHELSRTDLLELLARHKVTVIESETSIHGLSFREVQAQIGATKCPIFASDADLPVLNTPITLTFEVQHGAGNAIYASLRGIMARDPTRGGNVLYVQGPERLVITGMAPKVAAYRDLILLLDSAPDARIVSVYRVPSNTWEQLKTLTDEALRERLLSRTDKDVIRIEEVRVAGSDASFKRKFHAGTEVSFMKLELFRPRGPVKGGRLRPTTSTRIRLSITQSSGAENFQSEVEVDSPQTGPGAIASVSLKGADAGKLVVVVSRATEATSPTRDKARSKGVGVKALSSDEIRRQVSIAERKVAPRWGIKVVKATIDPRPLARSTFVIRTSEESGSVAFERAFKGHPTLLGQAGRIRPLKKGEGAGFEFEFVVKIKPAK